MDEGNLAFAAQSTQPVTALSEPAPCTPPVVSSSLCPSSNGLKLLRRQRVVEKST